jgi:hypothetical protein
MQKKKYVPLFNPADWYNHELEALIKIAYEPLPKLPHLSLI